jgi:hypothetical protein
MVGREEGVDIVRPAPTHDGRGKRRFDWKQKMMGNRNKSGGTDGEKSSDVEEEFEKRPSKWSMGILNDRETEEVFSPCEKDIFPLRDGC